MKPINSRRILARRQSGSFLKKSMKEPKSLAVFEARAKVKLGASEWQVLNKANALVHAFETIKARPEKVLIVFPLTSQGGNFYFAQGLFKVLAPKVRVVSLLTTGHAEHEKAITHQVKNMLRGRSKVIVFDDRYLGHTESNIRSALYQNGIEKENISYHDLAPNPLGSKMSAYVRRNGDYYGGGVQLLGINDANLIRLMYHQVKGLRKNTQYSEWMNRGKVPIDIYEHVLDKMHMTGILNKDVIEKSNLELYDKVNAFDPVFTERGSNRVVPTKDALKRIFEVVPKERIDALVRKVEKQDAKLKRAEYLKGIAAAKDFIEERAKAGFS